MQTDAQYKKSEKSQGVLSGERNAPNLACRGGFMYVEYCQNSQHWTSTKKQFNYLNYPLNNVIKGK